MEVRYSLCPNCDACPEVAIGDDSVRIGEEGNQVRLSASEWNVLVAAVKEGRLQTVGGAGETARDDGCGCDCGCCG
jgi:hypothetical protein